MFPQFEVATRLRPVAVVGTVSFSEEYDAAVPRSASAPTPHPAPYAAVEVDLTGDAPAGRLSLALAAADGTRLAVRLEPKRRDADLEVTTGGESTVHRSRRHGRAPVSPTRVGLALTGTHVSALTEERGHWVVRARVGLEDLGVDVRDLGWLATLESSWSWSGDDGPAPVSGWRAGGFGRLGLRDLRLVTERDGSPYRPDGPDGPVLLTATSAGPGFFDTAHTSVWSIDPDTPELRHLSDLFFERPDAPGGYGDHATHLVRDGDRWLVATSTWGDFDPRAKDASMRITLAETGADLLTGRHRLPTRELAVPTDGLASVGVWDPHLVHTGTEWLVGFVSARRFFDFHPAYAAGPSLDDLTLRGAVTDRTATEGTTILPHGDGWLLLASDGPDNPRGRRAQYPVFALNGALHQTGTLRAPYPTNIPWPTLVPPAPGGATGRGSGEWWLVTFDGTRYGGALPGYGTHGDVVLLRGVEEAD
ncbi:hypothetical protein HNR19_003668 [Nocardioides thalensis]|uniref:Uncharacterized protein n=1 Tax=Nocardioides thalensis TaxID=1914755 RepID=A0A853C4D4_9ACTN|nr:hypothetical protein [Nocardioides thalensis]NYJ02970.1 hypothetical protein [Nocardioides thalensis]